MSTHDTENRPLRVGWDLPYLPAFAALALAVIGCGPIADPEMRAGGLYSIEDGSGAYRAAKLLAFDSAVVHLRIYSNGWKARPDTISPMMLRLVPRAGEMSGREHFPVARHIFRAWGPELIGFDSVDEEERRLVREWERTGERAVGEPGGR